MAKEKASMIRARVPLRRQSNWKAGVEFHVYEYEHSNDHMDDGYGVEAATQAGFDEASGVQDVDGGHRCRTRGGRGTG